MQSDSGRCRPRAFVDPDRGPTRVGNKLINQVVTARPAARSAEIARTPVDGHATRWAGRDVASDLSVGVSRNESRSSIVPEHRVREAKSGVHSEDRTPGPAGPAARAALPDMAPAKADGQ